MKRFFIVTILGSALCLQAMAQSIDKLIGVKEGQDHLTHLASDDMMGRDTGSPEIDIAAAYIVDTFKKYGVKQLPGQDGFYQEVSLMKTNVPMKGEVVFLDSTLTHGKNILVLRGKDTTAILDAIFAGWGTGRDLDSLDIENKIVVTKFGFPGMTNVREGFKVSRDKRKMVAAKGGLGLIELYSSVQINWSLLTMYLNRPSMVINDHSDSKIKSPYHMFVNDADNAYLTMVENKGIKKIKLDASGLTPELITGKNIIGYIEGTDKNMKNEYVVLSAHYDHVGHTKASMKGGEPVDSIFNGARDNALGTTGLLMAAKYFGKNPPKRSVLFVGFTAEEKGLLGSEYYAEHPWIALNQCIFNVNIDCAGYNDKTIATVFGLTRNSAENVFRESCGAFGLEVIDDPIPEQNIFERSDHYNFAKKGVPCVLFGPGVTAFDEEIQKYYHQVNDQVETMDFEYINKVYKGFIKASEAIANAEEAPFWVEGDKYEAVGKSLYNKE